MIQKMILKIASAFALVVGQASIGTACCGPYHQPKVPEEMLEKN